MYSNIVIALNYRPVGKIAVSVLQSKQISSLRRAMSMIHSAMYISETASHTVKQLGFRVHNSMYTDV